MGCEVRLLSHTFVTFVFDNTVRVVARNRPLEALDLESVIGFQAWSSSSSSSNLVFLEWGFALPAAPMNGHRPNSWSTQKLSRLERCLGCTSDVTTEKK